MKICKFKKRVEIDKTIGNFRLETFHYSSYENDKHKNWTELCCWYERDCEHCPSCWENRSYEGECYDCGCYLAKKGHEDAPMLICMLPNRIKRIILKSRK